MQCKLNVTAAAILKSGYFSVAPAQHLVRPVWPAPSKTMESPVCTPTTSKFSRTDGNAVIMGITYDFKLIFQPATIVSSRTCPIRPFQSADTISRNERSRWPGRSGPLA